MVVEDIIDVSIPTQMNSTFRALIGFPLLMYC